MTALHDNPCWLLVMTGLQCGLSLEACWSLAPSELMALSKQKTWLGAGLTRDQLNQLISAYPDKEL